MQVRARSVPAYSHDIEYFIAGCQPFRCDQAPGVVSEFGRYMGAPWLIPLLVGAQSAQAGIARRMTQDFLHGAGQKLDPLPDLMLV